MADAGLRLTVEGEKEFKAAVKDINQLLKLNQAELQKITAEYNASDKSITDLTGKQKEMGEVVDRQTAIVAQMEEELARLTEEYGENATGVVKMKTETDKAKAALANMQAQMNEVNAELEKNIAEQKNAAGAAESFASIINSADEAIEALAKELEEENRKMEDGSSVMDLFGKSAEKTEKEIESLTRQNELLGKSVEEHQKKLDALNAEMDEAITKYGSQSGKVELLRKQISLTKDEIDEMNRKIDDNSGKLDKMEMDAGDVLGVFGDIGDMVGVQIPAGLDKIVSSIGGVNGAAGVAAGAIGAMAAVIAQALGQNREYALSIEETATLYGMTTDEVQELQYACKMLNVDFENVVDTTKDLKKNMYDAANGNKELASEFYDLGVEIFDSNGQLRNSMDVLADLVDAYGRMHNSTERAARMQILLGENSKSLNALIYAGGDAIDYYRKQAYEYGIVMDKEMIAKTKEAARETTALGEAWNAYWRNSVSSMGELWGSLITGDWDTFGKHLIGQSSAVKARNDSAWGMLEALLGKIGWNADGTYNWRGGLSVVGERGPEIVDLPAGSRVYPNGEFPEMGTVNYYNVSINAKDVREFNDIVRIAQNQRVNKRLN